MPIISKLRKDIIAKNLSRLQDIDLEHGLLNLALERGVFSKMQKDGLEKDVEHGIGHSTLFLSILDRTSDEKYELFCECLIEDGQQQFVNEILWPEYVTLHPNAEKATILSESRKKMLTSSWATLVENLNTDDSLIYKLLEERVITKTQRTSIEGNQQHTLDKKNNVLLDIISHCSNEKYERFCQVLWEQGQEALVTDYLWPEYQHHSTERAAQSAMQRKCWTLANRRRLEDWYSIPFMFVPDGNLVIYNQHKKTFCMYSTEKQRFTSVSPHTMATNPSYMLLAYHQILNCIVIKDGSDSLTLLNAEDLSLNGKLAIQCSMLTVMEKGYFIVVKGIDNKILLYDVTGKLVRSITAKGILSDIASAKNIILSSSTGISGYLAQDEFGVDLYRVEDGLSICCMMTVDPHSNVWISDIDNKCLKVYDCEGRQISKVHLDGINPMKISVGSQGKLVMCDLFEPKIWIYDIKE